MVSDLQGAIIAAGHGERLRSAVGGLPKPLVEIGGQTLLERQARAMLDAGARSVRAVVDSETARLIDERSVRLPAGTSLIVRDTANSMESLFALGERLEPARFLLATVDAVISTPEVRRFVIESEASCDAQFDGVLAVSKWRGDPRPLFAQIADGVITEVGARKARCVTAGFYFLPAEVFRFIDQARAAGLGALREFLAMLVHRGMRLAAIELNDVIDIDTPADLELARTMLSAENNPR